MWKMAAEWRITLLREVRRKTIHITGLVVPFGLVIFGKIFTAYAIALALVVAAFVEAGRLSGLVKLPAVREQEMHKIAGYIYYIIGSLLTVVIFRPTIAITAMLMLSLGDAVSGLIGSILENSNVRSECKGKGWRIKPLPITSGMFLACLIIGYLSSTFTQLPFEVYLAGAVGATIADGVCVFVRSKVLDDNLTIPLCAGTLMSVVALI